MVTVADQILEIQRNVGALKSKDVRFSQIFPGRFDWHCPKCGEWHRYYEIDCPYEEN